VKAILILVLVWTILFKSAYSLQWFEEPVLLNSMGEGAGEISSEADNAEETGFLASLQGPHSNAHDIYSALVREGLFDTVMRFCRWNPLMWLTLLSQIQHQDQLILQLLIQLKAPYQRMKLFLLRRKKNLIDGSDGISGSSED
jgi:hypothetical protein